MPGCLPSGQLRQAPSLGPGQPGRGQPVRPQGQDRIRARDSPAAAVIRSKTVNAAEAGIRWPVM